MKRVIKLVGVVLLQLLFFSVNAAQFKAVDIAHDKDYGYQVSDEFSRNGGTSERFEVRHGDCAGEDCWRDRQRYEVGITQPYSKDDHWYGWSFYLPNNFMIQPAGTAMGQAKLFDGPVMWMVLTKHTDYIQIASDNKEQKCNLIKIDDAVGNWTDIMIRANYSTSSKEPLDVWINGKNIGCNFKHPLITKAKLNNTKGYKKGDGNNIAFKYGIYQTFISRWLDKRKTKETSGDVDTEKWRRPSGKCCKSPDNTPFNEDWGVETPTAVMYYDGVSTGKTRDEVNTLYSDLILDSKKPPLKKNIQVSDNKALKFIMDSSDERYDPVEARLGHSYITYSSPKNSYGYKISDKLSRIGDTSERFELRHGDCNDGYNGKYFSTCANDRQKFRRQVLIPFSDNDNDSEIWYSYSFYLPKNFIKGFKVQPAGTAMGASTFQYLGHPRSKWQVLTKNTDWIQFKSHGRDACNLIKIDDAIDKWTDIMIRTDWSPSSKNPVDVWINGKNSGCVYNTPLTKEEEIKNTGRYKAGLDNIVNFTYGIYQTYVSRWLDKHKTKETSGDISDDTSGEWLTPSGKNYRSPDRTPFNEDWGVKLPTAVMYYDAIRVGRSRDAVNIFYDDATLDLFESQLAEESKSSPLFDGRYSFDLFRYHDDDDEKYLGWGFIEIRNGEITIDKHSKSYLETGLTDLYDTFSGQINKEGEISSSVELDILKGKDRSEVYHLKGKVGEKIWGDSPREEFYRIYMSLVKE